MFIVRLYFLENSASLLYINIKIQISTTSSLYDVVLLKRREGLSRSLKHISSHGKLEGEWQDPFPSPGDHSFGAKTLAKWLSDHLRNHCGFYFARLQAYHTRQSVALLIRQQPDSPLKKQLTKKKYSGNERVSSELERLHHSCMVT